MEYWNQNPNNDFKNIKTIFLVFLAATKQL